MYRTEIPDSVIFFEETKTLASKLADILANYSDTEKPLLICGQNSYKELAHSVLEQLNPNKLNLEVSPAIEEILEPEFDFQGYSKSNSPVIAIGGGKILDYAKYLTFKTGRLLISIPSNASHDGIFSPISVISGLSLGSKRPDYLLIPLNILKKAPVISIQSGIGDLIANFTAIYDASLSKAIKHEAISEEALFLSYSASKAITDMIYEYCNADRLTSFLSNNTEKRKILLEALFRSYTFLKQFIHSLVLSGIAMDMAKSSRPCSGSEHMISHAIDKLYGHGVKATHGIQVAVASNYIIEKQIKSLQNLSQSLPPHLAEALQRDFQTYKLDFNIDELLFLLSMPRNFQDIGIKEEEIPQILELAPTTRAGKFSVLTLLTENLQTHN